MTLIQGCDRLQPTYHLLLSLYSLFIHLSCILLTFSISSYIVFPVDKSGGGAGLTLPRQRRLGDYPTFS